MKVVVVVIQDTADQGGGTLSLSLSHLLFSWNMMEENGPLANPPASNTDAGPNAPASIAFESLGSSTAFLSKGGGTSCAGEGLKARVGRRDL